MTALAALAAMILKGWLWLSAWLGIALQAGVAVAWTIARAKRRDRLAALQEWGPWGPRPPPGGRTTIPTQSEASMVD